MNLRPHALDLLNDDRFSSGIILDVTERLVAVRFFTATARVYIPTFTDEVRAEVAMSGPSYDRPLSPAKMQEVASSCLRAAEFAALLKGKVTL